MSMLGCKLKTVRFYCHVLYCLLTSKKFKNVNMRENPVKDGRYQKRIMFPLGELGNLRQAWYIWKHHNLREGCDKMHFREK